MPNDDNRRPEVYREFFENGFVGRVVTFLRLSPAHRAL
jgi:hypothetical protein